MAFSTREKPGRPLSPIQRRKSPITRHLSPSPISLRARMKMRIGILILCGIVSIAILNELRCLKYVCISRVGFYGGEGTRRVGGGSVLPEGWKTGAGEKSVAVMTSEDAQKLVEVQFGQGNSVGMDEGDRDGEGGGKDGNGKWMDETKEVVLEGKPQKETEKGGEMAAFGVADGSIGSTGSTGWPDEAKSMHTDKATSTTTTTSGERKKSKVVVASPSPVAKEMQKDISLSSSPLPLTSDPPPPPAKTNLTLAMPKAGLKAADYDFDNMISHTSPKPKPVMPSHSHPGTASTSSSNDYDYQTDEEDFVKDAESYEDVHGHAIPSTSPISIIKTLPSKSTTSPEPLALPPKAVAPIAVHAHPPAPVSVQGKDTSSSQLGSMDMAIFGGGVTKS